MNYISHMFEVMQIDELEAWVDGLHVRHAQAQIGKRIVRIQSGLLGDVEPVGKGVGELRIHYGPGYRLYLRRRQRQSGSRYCAGKGNGEGGLNVAVQLKPFDAARYLSTEKDHADLLADAFATGDH